MIYPKPYSIYLLGTLHYYVDGVVFLVRERGRERERERATAVATCEHRGIVLGVMS